MNRTPLGYISLALGVVSLPMLFVCMLGLPLGVAAIAAGGVGLARREPARTTALAGIVLGLLAVAAAVVFIVRPDD
jgi:hypothetical protein